MKKKEEMNLFAQILTEYKNVSWPNKRQVFQVTVIVLLITLFISLFILVFDFTFVQVVDRISRVLKSLIGG